MITLGIIFLIGGIIMAVAGNSQNNNLEMQFESMFSSGRANPGDLLLIGGIILIVIGLILIIAGAARLSNKNNSTPAGTANSEGAPLTGGNTVSSEYICKNCGATVPADSKYCNKCGTEVIQDTYCPNCGEKVPEGSLFCNKCGNKLTSEETEQLTPQAGVSEETVVSDGPVCKNCGEKLPANSKFCYLCGTSVENEIFCPFCGKKLPADSTFCYECGGKIEQKIGENSVEL